MPSTRQARHLTEKTFEAKSAKVVVALIDISLLMNDTDSSIGFPQDLQTTPRNRA
jgi:hypothetical protein